MNDRCKGVAWVPYGAGGEVVSPAWTQFLMDQTLARASGADVWELSLSHPTGDVPEGVANTLLESMLWSLLARPEFQVVLQPLAYSLSTEVPRGVTDQYTTQQLRQVLDSGYLAMWRPARPVAAKDAATQGDLDEEYSTAIQSAEDAEDRESSAIGAATETPATVEDRLLQAAQSPRRLLLWNKALVAEPERVNDTATATQQPEPAAEPAPSPQRTRRLTRVGYSLRGWLLQQGRERLPLGLKIRIKRLLGRGEEPTGPVTTSSAPPTREDLPLARLRTWTPPFPRPQVTLDLPAGAPERIPVLVAVHWLELGGAEKFAVDLIHALPKEEYAVYVTTDVASKNPWASALAEHVEEVIHLPEFLTPSMFGVFYEYYIRTRGIRLLHIHHGPKAYESLFHIRRFHPGLKVLDSLHIVELPPHSGGYPEFSCANFEVFIDCHHVISEHLRNFLRQRWLVAEDKIQVTYLNVDTTYFDPAVVDACAVRRRHGIPASACVVGFIGRMVYQKQPVKFIHTAYRLHKRWKEHGREQPLHFLMVGSGPLQSEVEMAIRAKGLERVVHLHGEVDDTRPAYRDCDLLLMPSINEGLALVAYEAMSMELPLFFTDVGAQRELLPAEFLVAVDGAVAEAMADAAWPLLLDPERRRRIGREMRRYILHKHRVEQTMEQMSTLYRGLLNPEEST